MVSRRSLARVATDGLTSSTEAKKQQKAWAKEYLSRWFFVTAPMSRKRHSTATFSTVNIKHKQIDHEDQYEQHREDPKKYNFI